MKHAPERQRRIGFKAETHRGSPKQVSKPGKHGTLYLWRITYKDSDNPMFGEDSFQKWAYDKQAAWDAFNEQVNDEGESWEIVKIDPVLDTGPKRLSREVGETHVVNDFNTIDDLIAHAGEEGATHYSTAYGHTKIWFPLGGGKYAEATARQAEGYWHLQGPSDRRTVGHPPPLAKKIEKHRTREPQFKLGAPRPGTSVRDYEAVDGRDRHIAGPFKNYSDAKHAAGPGGHVKYVRPGARAEAKRGEAKKYWVVDQEQPVGTNKTLWVQVGHFHSKQAAERFRKQVPGKARIVHTWPGQDYPVVGAIGEVRSARRKRR